MTSPSQSPAARRVAPRLVRALSARAATSLVGALLAAPCGRKAAHARPPPRLTPAPQCALVAPSPAARSASEPAPLGTAARRTLGRTPPRPRREAAPAPVRAERTPQGAPSRGQGCATRSADRLGPTPPNQGSAFVSAAAVPPPGPPGPPRRRVSRRPLGRDPLPSLTIQAGERSLVPAACREGPRTRHRGEPGCAVSSPVSPS